MKARHLEVREDNALLRRIQRSVREEVDMSFKKLLPMLWLKFIFYFAISVAFYVGLFVARDVLSFVMIFILYGFASLLFAFNFAHDLSHSTVFEKGRWNDLGFIFIYTLVGAHAEEWKYRHVHSHHFAPNVEGHDTDLKISGLIRVIPGSRRAWYHRFQHIYAPIAYTSYSLFWVFIKDFVIYRQSFHSGKAGSVTFHFSFWCQKLFYIGYLLVLPLLFSQVTWQVVLLAFVAMHLLQSLFLLFTFFMTHHVESTCYPTTDGQGRINSSWLMNQIRSSNDMHPFSESANFIFGGFNNHIAHHLFPDVHHIHYPRLNEVLYRILNEEGIVPNETSYWGGILSHLRMLKKMGKDEGYSTSATTKVLPPTKMRSSGEATFFAAAKASATER